jgi:hypothetical protein
MADKSLCSATRCEESRACRRHADCPDRFQPNDYWQSYAEFEPEKGADCSGFVRQKFTPIGALVHEWSKDPERAAMIKLEG